MTEQVPLFSTASVDRIAGAVEQATARSLRAAGLDAQDEGAGQALLALAWSLDAARAAGKFYGVAQAAPPYQQLAESLGLTPSSRKEGTDDALDGWLAGLTAPTMGDTSQP